MAILGNGTVVKIDSRAGDLTDLSTYARNENLSEQVEAHDVTTYGATARAQLPGMKGANFEIEFIWDPTLDAFMDLRVGKIGSFEIGPEGSSSGDTKYSGEALCTGYSGSHPGEGEATATASFTVTDTLTKGSYS